MTRTSILLLAGAAVLLGGCAPSTPAQTPPTPAATTPTSAAIPAATTPPSSPPPSPEPTSTAPTSAPPLPTGAADGRNLAACNDGACEVLLDKPTSIRLDPKLRVRTLRVEAVRQDEVTLILGFPAGTVSYACEGGTQCTVVGATATSPASAQAVGKAGARVTVNGLRLEVVAAHEGAAVLRLTPV